MLRASSLGRELAADFDLTLPLLLALKVVVNKMEKTKGFLPPKILNPVHCESYSMTARDPLN